MREWLHKTLLNDQDELAELRGHIVKPVSVAAAALLMVLVVNHFLQGRWALGVVVLIVAATLLVNLRGLQPGKRPPVPYVLILLPGLGAMIFSIWQQGIYGVLWSYPLTLISFFVLTLRTALMFSLAVLTSVTTIVGLWISVPLAMRVFATLMLCAVMIIVVLRMLGELQASLLRQTLIDPLTGAFNRRSMDQVIGTAVEQGRRHTPINALLVFDIDHFKLINDRYGHGAGDEVLCRVVQVVRARLRKTDPLFRVGGEEFMVLLYDTDAAGASSVAEDLRGRIEQETLLAGEVITVSLGVGPQVAGQNIDEWLKATDQALYRAKNAGRNRVEMVTEAS